MKTIQLNIIYKLLTVIIICLFSLYSVAQSSLEKNKTERTKKTEINKEPKKINNIITFTSERTRNPNLKNLNDTLNNYTNNKQKQKTNKKTKNPALRKEN